MDAQILIIPAESPVLPTDLERVIFEITALSHPRSIPNLLLVAWRVHKWLVHTPSTPMA
jgi:hypothetical protein